MIITSVPNAVLNLALIGLMMAHRKPRAGLFLKERTRREESGQHHFLECYQNLVVIDRIDSYENLELIRK